MRAVDIGGGRVENSCVNGSDNVWVLWEVVGFLGMRVQNAQLGSKTSVVSRRSGVDIRAFHLLQVFDVFFHFRSVLLEGDRVGIQGCSILDIGCVYCILEILYIRLELGDVLLKVVFMVIVNRS